MQTRPNSSYDVIELRFGLMNDTIERLHQIDKLKKKKSKQSHFIVLNTRNLCNLEIDAFHDSSLPNWYDSSFQGGSTEFFSLTKN